MHSHAAVAIGFENDIGIQTAMALAHETRTAVAMGELAIHPRPTRIELLFASNIFTNNRKQCHVFTNLMRSISPWPLPWRGLVSLDASDCDLCFPR